MTDEGAAWAQGDAPLDEPALLARLQRTLGQATCTRSAARGRPAQASSIAR